MGALCFKPQHYERFKRRVEVVEPEEYISPRSGLENFEFSTQQYGVQAYAEPWDEDGQEHTRNYAAARIRNALQKNDLSTLPEELQDVRKLADLTMLYSQRTLRNAPEKQREFGQQWKATASPAKDRNRYYLLPPLILRHVKAQKIGAEDSPATWQ